MHCDFCHIPDEDTPFQLAETACWSIYLANDQAYLGRCIILLRRHCGDLADLTPEEWLDLGQVVKRVEVALRQAFGATMFNWACLMNDAYKSAPPNPHVHWHVRPRYDHAVAFGGLTFEDPEFARHYNNRKAMDVPLEVRLAIAERVRGLL